MAGIINAMAMRQAVMANTPHTATASGSMASFSTDMVGKLRHLVVGIEPVQAGSGDPSPENIRPITGCTGAKVTRTGKNLLQLDVSSSPSFYGCTIAVDKERGSITADGTVTSVAIPYLSNKNFMAGTYTLSGGAANLKIDARYYPSNSKISGSECYGDAVTFTAVSPFRLCVVFLNGAVLDNVTIYPMLQRGAGTAGFVPYTGTTIPISWESVAGTVYGGMLDVVTGVLTVDRAMVTFDGSNMTNISMDSTKYADQKRLFIGRQRFVPASASPSASSAVGNIRSNQYKTASADTTYLTREICIASRSNGAYIYDNNLQSLEAFSTAWQATPLQIVYELAVHQTCQLSPTMVKSLIGTNHVWADTGDVESLTYWTH